MNSGRPGGLSVSTPVFNFRLASAGGAQAGNACFWFQVRSGGSVIGTHGSYASAAGCSAGTTQTTISTAIAEVTSTDQVNGLVVLVYPWETGTKTKVVNVDLATVTGSTPYNTFTAYETQWVDAQRRAAVSARVGGRRTTYRREMWPGRLSRVPEARFGPDQAGEATAVSLKNTWHAATAVTNGGTLCYLETSTDDLCSPSRQRRPPRPGCTAAERSSVSTRSPARGERTRRGKQPRGQLYWVSPTCGGVGTRPRQESVDQAEATFNYYLD
jgi:hypothetical protein